MPGALDDILRQELASGPISIERYMTLCLQHYYTQATPLGEDFITGPEISQILGELVGLWGRYVWENLYPNVPVTILELGPGRGVLLRDVIRAWKPENATLAVVDIHPNLLLPMNDVMRYKTIGEALDALQGRPIFLLANEFFDALPLRQFIREKGEWRERGVAYKDGALEFVSMPCEGAFPDTDFYEDLTQAQEAWALCLKHLQKWGGAFWVCDYGDWHPKGDTLAGVVRHQSVSPLHAPGQVDLSVHVNFAGMVERATAHKVWAAPLLTQREFIMGLGGDMRLAKLLEQATLAQKEVLIQGYLRLTKPELMGTLFKVLMGGPADIAPLWHDIFGERE